MCWKAAVYSGAKNIFTNNPSTTLVAERFFFGMKSRWRIKKKLDVKAKRRKGLRGAIKFAHVNGFSNDSHPQNVHPTRFSCVRHATGENTRKSDNAENTRMQPVRLSILARFSQLATVRCETSRLFRSLQILHLRIYKYIHRVQRKSHPPKSYHDDSLFGLIRFFKKFPAIVEIFRRHINIDLNLFRRDFCETESFALTLSVAKFFERERFSILD